jgi:sugar/nucleoside kinase (ribokinase family)
MPELIPLDSVDYLAVGHVSIDRTPSGPRLGGTVSYAALTARALGMRVGIVTSASEAAPLQPLAGIPLVCVPADATTEFENIPLDPGRRQILHHRAAQILLEHIPQTWRTAPIIHLAPIASEFDPGLAAELQASLLGVTPQGWLRDWDDSGQVFARLWEDPDVVLKHSGAVVFSLEDLDRDLERVESYAHQTRLLCVTEGGAGCVVYWNGDRRRIPAPAVEKVDSTGAGDIFASAFFVRLYMTRDPWEAARFATQAASFSISRTGLDGIPTPKEIEDCYMEVLP